jgi:PfaD family protein
MGQAHDLRSVVHAVREPAQLLRDRITGEVTAVRSGHGSPHAGNTREIIGVLPPLYPEWLGDRTFQEAHGVRFPYVTGAMANGIATPALVAAIGRAGMLGFYGAAGLAFERVEEGLAEIERLVAGEAMAWGANLIHSPAEPALEDRVAELYVRRGVRWIEASAFMDLSPSIVLLACHGLRVDERGQIARPRHVIAKVSRPEVARRFMSPAPKDTLGALVKAGKLSTEEARLAEHVPIAGDVTVEADSGGHTDNRPLGVLLPLVLALRDSLPGARGSVRVGAAGGLGTPAAVAGAFALGAAYVVTGSINQAAVESGLSAEGKRLLAEADLADVAMAAAADMFEQGVKVQVLKRGTLFAARANKLYEAYRTFGSLEDIPPAARHELETRVLGTSLEAVWRETERFWRERDATQLHQAAGDPRHKLALCFRWYLGRSSRWAIEGETARRADYQIWCGPAMGAFNAWAKGSVLEPVEQRGVAQIALNLLEGAAVATRAHQLRTFGVAVPAEAFHFRPRRIAVEPVPADGDGSVPVSRRVA